MTDLFWSFAPWVVFLAAGRVGSFWAAIVAGTAASLVVLARAIWRRRAHMLDAVPLVYFMALAVGVAASHPGDLDAMARYAQAGAHAVLTTVIFASVLVRRPFTASYARQNTPQEYWHSAEFRSINERISIAWGLAFLVGTISLIVAGTVDVRQVLLRVIVPFGALVWAYKYTQHVIAEVDTAPGTSAPDRQQHPNDAVR
jgi:hypothetical protein